MLFGFGLVAMGLFARFDVLVDESVSFYYIEWFWVCGVGLFGWVFVWGGLLFCCVCAWVGVWVGVGWGVVFCVVVF